VRSTPRSCYRSISIVADGRLEVCDGAHRAFVVKKEVRYFRGSSRDCTCLAVCNFCIFSTSYFLETRHD